MDRIRSSTIAGYLLPQIESMTIRRMREGEEVLVTQLSKAAGEIPGGEDIRIINSICLEFFRFLYIPTSRWHGNKQECCETLQGTRKERTQCPLATHRDFYQLNLWNEGMCFT